MKKLTIFKMPFVNELRRSIKDNLPKYTADKPWVNEIGFAATRDLETHLELQKPLDLLNPEGDDLKDLENAIRVHKALRQLSPLQARDPRLWVRLAHSELWNYMRKRWPAERYLKDGEKAVRVITERYFVPQSQSRALLRNGIARLWWTAHLSFDSSRANNYELTGMLLASLDITQQILERNMGRAPAVLKGFLDFLSRHAQPLLQGGDANRKRIRRLAIFLNLQGGVSILDCLDQEDIINHLEGEFARILEREKQHSKAVPAST
jgi:hypothetical protein